MKKPRSDSHDTQDLGFILPLIIIAGLIIGAGLMALSARTFAGLFGSIRQGQSREAREIAESGAAIILKELNRNYPYLLIEDCEISSRTGTPDCSGWKDKASGGSFTYRTSICPKSDAPPQNILSKLSGTTAGSTGRYRLISYNFTGDQHQGGTGRIKVMGEKISVLSSGTSVRATAFVDEELSVLPKNCNVPVNTPSEQSGFPGLMAERISLGNNDIFGDVNGNVLCTECNPNQTREALATQMGLQNNGTVEGNLYGGKVAIPPVPQFPPNAPITPSNTAITGNTTLSAGASNGGRCFTDSQNITHCKVSSINLSGNETLTINTGSSGAIRLYVDGNINITGNTALIHSGSPTALGIFGRPRSTSLSCSQNVTIGGGGTTMNLFLFMPDACVGINGGSGTPDIRGSVWAREYEGSNSNNADISVPDNMGSLSFTTFGSGFGLGIREFAALGTNRWNLIQLGP